MKTQNENYSTYRYKLNFGGFADDFILGVVCAKIGLVKHALENLESIRDNKGRLELFNYGVKDAANCRLEDLAQDLWELREQGTRIFDVMVLKSVGKNKFKEIKRVIDNRVAYKPSRHIVQSLEKFLSNYE
jgi:hypothetical protein